MASYIPKSFSDPLVLKALHAFTTTALGCLTGVAIGMLVWVIPVVRLAPTSLAKCRQFNYTISLGIKYLQPSSRVLPVLMLVLAYLSYSEASKDVKDPSPLNTMAAWSPYALAMATLVPTGPWEIYLIFPTNDKFAAMQKELEKAGKQDFGDKRDVKIGELLSNWQRWHLGRVVLPFIATAIMAGAAVDGRFGK